MLWLCFRCCGTLTHSRLNFFVHTLTQVFESPLKSLMIMMNLLESEVNILLHFLNWCDLWKLLEMLMYLLNAGLVGFVEEHLIIASYHLLRLLIALWHHIHFGIKAGKGWDYLAVEVFQVIIQSILLHFLPLPLSLWFVSLAGEVGATLHLVLLKFSR